VASAPWDEAELLRVARDYALAQLERHGPVAAWVVDDTGYPKKGRHSVGVARQYCGVLGKQDNCQVAVTVSLVNPSVSIPSAYRLYLPESWATDRLRRRAAGVPDTIAFAPKWAIALAEIDALLADDLPRAPVVADARYGVVMAFREGILARGHFDAVGISSETSVWPPGQGPVPPRVGSGQGRPPTRYRRTPRRSPVSAKALAESLAESEWKTVR
jgi:SRSO17 transposase